MPHHQYLSIPPYTRPHPTPPCLIRYFSRVTKSRAHYKYPHTSAISSSESKPLLLSPPKPPSFDPRGNCCIEDAENVAVRVETDEEEEKMSTAEMEPLTSGASNRIIPIIKALRTWLVLVHTFLVSVLLFFLPRRRPLLSPEAAEKRRWREEEDTIRRRALAERVDMIRDDDAGWCRWRSSLFFGVKKNALFYRSWLPVSGEMRGILIIIHGLNEHGGRYVHFAKQLISCNFGVYAMDWTGHGGSDGLHGYVPSLDQVVADTVAFLEKLKAENPGTPCFLFGHSTGGALVVKAVALIFSLIAPRFQFKGANKKGIPVSRDPAALLEKYSDPLVYTGPMRVRTGHEILRISTRLMRKIKSVTVPFFVLHGTADRVTDPLASQELYNEAASMTKDIKLYDGFLHDLLFEPEKEQVGEDIISWMEKRLYASNGKIYGNW